MTCIKSFLPIVVIFVLALFLHFYKLGTIPPGLNQDETSIGYNAYSILVTGKDQYGKNYPLYFKSFGDEKLPVYIYLTVLTEKFFGLNAFAVRLPSAFLGAAGVVIFYFLILELSKNKTYSFLATVFFALNPWHLFLSRASFEDNTALAFTLFGVLMFLKSITGKGNIFYALLSLFGFILSFYSYNVTRLLSPLLLILLIVLYWNDVRKIPVSRILILVLTGFILSLPFIVTIFTKGGISSAKGALLTSADIRAKNLGFRSYTVGMPEIFGIVFFNNIIMTLWQYLENIVGYFSVRFFFISSGGQGSEWLQNQGQFYLFEFPFIVGGIVLYLKNRRHSFLRPIFYWGISVLLVASLSKVVPHATRGYFLVVPLSIFSSYGFYRFIVWIKKLKMLRRSMAYVTLFAFVLLSLVYYFSSYYLEFPIYRAREWRQEDKALSLYLKEVSPSYSKVVIDPQSNFEYASYLFYTKYPPSIFQKTAKYYPESTEGLIYIKSFANFEFRSIKKSDYKKNFLLVVSPDEHISLPVVKIFNYPQRPVVFSSQAIIYRYPTVDKAYVIQKTQ